MTKETLEDIRAWLNSYVDEYRADDGSLHYLLELKLDHSHRVAKDCRFIATALEWNESEINLAESIGLLHDIGRFSQFKEYNTFHDPNSVNHGQRGFEVAQTCDILNALDDDTRQIILDSIHFHNCRFIPKGLTDESVRHLKLIRDSDKIDIIYIVNHAIENRLHEKYPQIMLDVDLNGPLTPELINEVRETGTGSYRHVNSLADMNLMRLTWITSINYEPSCRLISDRKLMDNLAESIPSSPEVDDVTSTFMKHLNERLAT